MKLHILIFLSVVLFSCDRNHKVASENADQFMMAAFEASAPPVDRKIIQTGTLQIETSDIEEMRLEVEKICKEMGAYIASEDQSDFGERLQHVRVIRVPADKFSDLVKKLEALGIRVESRSINTQDVTEEFIDTGARLKTKKALEDRYHDLLKQAKSVTDIMAIESQIATVRSDIESMEGRLKYLTSQVSYSTLNLTYFEMVGTDFGFASKFVAALRSGWDFLLVFLIGLVTLWPFLTIGTALLWIVIRRRKLKRATA